MPMPCEMMCSKCGSHDVSRRFYEKGEAVLNHGRTPGKTTQFVDRSSSFNWYAQKDCIVHHCRICSVEWDTAPLCEG
jgi:hypothetical protein